MLDYIEIACRWIFALQMIFWGLNGFFNWVQIPPSSEGVTRFAQACVDTRFIMPTVKVIEIICGILLLIKFAMILNLMIFAPIIFVITLLHLIHNPKPWPVVLPVSLPFAIMFLIHVPALFATAL